MSVRKKTIASMKKAGADWLGKSIFGVIIGAGLFVYQPARDAVTERWTRGDRIEQQLQVQSDSIDGLHQDADAIRADIDALRRPNDIFEVSNFLSSPVYGYCGVPGVCEIELWVRRVHGAQACQIVADRTQHFLVNRETGISRNIQRLNPGATRNVGLDWTPLLVVLDVPVSVPVGQSLYYVVTFYAECPGAGPDDDPIRDESRPIEIELRKD